MAKSPKPSKAEPTISGNLSAAAPTAKVFAFAPERPGTFTDAERQLQAAGCHVIQGSASWHTPQGNSEHEIIAAARNADALMGTSIRSTPITRAIMEAAPDLRIVAKYTIGYDDVDVAAATELGIIVTHSPTEANWGGVAEGSMAMMLALLKKVRERDEAMKAGKWRSEDLQGAYVGARMQDGYEGLTIGIVGLGRIGRRLSDLLKPWRVKILAHDPYCEVARFTLSGVHRSNLDDLLRQSDVVSLHCTLNESSRHLINAKRLAMMKPTAILLNAARGGIVDEAALVSALEKGTIAGAALDVFEHEPLSPSSPLLKLGHKVLLSAHMVSGNANSGIKPGAVWAAQNVAAALRGELPENIVNPEVLPRWKQRFISKPVIGPG
jgi:D-3-phosphoglycerate dehydrogenase / 2-oxoglutarate reductase